VWLYVFYSEISASQAAIVRSSALAFVLTVPVHAQDFDAYKVRLSGFWASLNSFRKPARIL
jgi:hypothetical protein